MKQIATWYSRPNVWSCMTETRRGRATHQRLAGGNNDEDVSAGETVLAEKIIGG